MDSQIKLGQEGDLDPMSRMILDPMFPLLIHLADPWEGPEGAGTMGGGDLNSRQGKGCTHWVANCLLSELRDTMLYFHLE